MDTSTPSNEDFLAHFNCTDQAWLKQNGKPREFLASQDVSFTNVLGGHIHLVQEGLVAHYKMRKDGNRSLIAQLGPGELIGDVAWFAGQANCDSLVAEQPALLLTWDREVLEQRLHSDQGFASVFYKAVATSCAQKAFQKIAPLANDSFHGLNGIDKVSHDSQLTQLHNSVEEFKDLIAQADKFALKGDGSLQESTFAQAQECFNSLVIRINAVIGTDATMPESAKEEVGAALQREFLPYLSLTETADRFYSKPRGYAGDFLTIAKMYEDIPGGVGRVGALIDSCFLRTGAAAAVRNRRHLLCESIEKTLTRNKGARTHITSLACGPAQEVFDAYEALKDPALLHCSLIDIDPEALAYVSAKSAAKQLSPFVETFNSNLLYIVSGRHKLKLPPQDLMYSIGLIDYFGDKFVVQLLNFIYETLKPGGSVILGNFHNSNPTRALMDHILNWKLIHRNEQDMHRLFVQSKFAKAADGIHFEDEKINMFAQCYKD